LIAEVLVLIGTIVIAIAIITANVDTRARQDPRDAHEGILMAQIVTRAVTSTVTITMMAESDITVREIVIVIVIARESEIVTGIVTGEAREKKIVLKEGRNGEKLSALSVLVVQQ
jgi:hypothetical protein